MGIAVAIVVVGGTGNVSLLAIAIVTTVAIACAAIILLRHRIGVAIVRASTITIVLGHPRLLAIVGSSVVLLRGRWSWIRPHGLGSIAIRGFLTCNDATGLDCTGFL